MERDDLYVNDSYAVAANHDEEYGKKARKNIWKVAIILTIITLVEVVIGASIPRGSEYWTFVKIAFLVMTLMKAAWIVLDFMHLGDEKRGLKIAILVPYIIFIAYLIFIAISESTYNFDMIYGA